jgi:hypothetical protein
LIETNEFVMAFQLLNDNDGFNNYDAVKGGAFSAIDPFLFGDLGRTLFFFLVVMATILLKDRLVQWFGEMGRRRVRFYYFLLLVALCGMYNALIDNKVLGLSMYLFCSHWECNSLHSDWLKSLSARCDTGGCSRTTN